MTEKIEIDQSLIRDFLDESLDLLATIDNLLVVLETHPHDLELINSIFRPIHSIKGNAPFFGLTKIRTLAHDLESLLSLVRGQTRIPSPQLISVVLKGTDELRNMLNRARDGKPEVVDDAGFESLLDIVKNETELKPSPEIAAAGSIFAEDTVKPTAITAEDAAKTEAQKTMRVSEKHIDNFLAYVGELLVVGEMLSYLHKRVVDSNIDVSISTEFKRLNQAFAKLSHDLQRSIMSIRKLPIRTLLQKSPRLARDVAAAAGKEINVSIEGDDLEIDKSIIERLDAPLTHLIRNSVDHGIEQPEQRINAGKSRVGQVSIRVSESETQLIIVVEDDGAGLNLAAIREKAERIGIIQPGQLLSAEETQQLIFAAGVSTAKKVSDVSGRGVGMDVVKHMVEEAGGSISIESKEGKGTRFELCIGKSVTTQIMNGFVIDLKGQCFIVPMEVVGEIVHCDSRRVRSMSGKGEFIEHHGKIIPVVALSFVLGLAGKLDYDPESQLMVTVRANKQVYALRVDSVIGFQQIVLKKMNLVNVSQDRFVGSALMGDGRVALVMDINKVCSENLS